jgi:superfamily II DNA or RNA helicase
VILTAPTGSGKRYIAVWCSLQAGEQNKRILIVTHRKILVDQMVQELRVHGAHVGVLMAGYEEPNPIAPIQVASLQTLWSRCLRQGCYGKPLPEAQLIVIDECHQESRRYHQLLEHYPRAWVMGLTATPVGREGLRLDDFHTIVEGSLNSQLIHDGWLLPTVVYAPSEPDVTGVTIQRGDYSQKKLSRRVREVTLWGDIWKEYAKHEDRSAIVFAPGVAYCEGLVRSFRGRLGSDGAAIITAKTPDHEREDILEEFAEQRCRVLLSVDVLREGFDSPVASLAIDLQPNRPTAFRTFWQKVGRIKRPHGEQKECVWIDMAGNVWNHQHPNTDPPWKEISDTVSTATLRERQSEPERTPIVCSRCGAVRVPGAAVCPQCGLEAGGVAVRFVRTGAGELVEVPVRKRQARTKTMEERWSDELWAGYHSKRTLRACRHMYMRRNGRYPADRLPGMPPPGSTRWGQRVADVYSRRDLAAMRHHKGRT